MANGSPSITISADQSSRLTGKGFFQVFGSVIGAVIVCYAALVVGMYLAQRHFMYQPGHDLIAPGESEAPEFSSITLTTDDGLSIESWIALPEGGAKDQKVMVYFHGNAGHIGDRAHKVRPYLDAGIGIMLVGYRGYGRNPGSPTESGFYKDAETALKYLFEQGVNPASVILYGESLGTGVAVEMAKRLNTGGTAASAVILEAPFLSMGDAAQTHYPYLPAKFLVKDKYDSASKMTDINAPLMIVHGKRDRVVPFRQGEKLFETAREPKVFKAIDSAAHNDLYDFDAAKFVLKFIND